VSDKARALRVLSARAADALSLDAAAVHQVLNAQEEIGGTSVGGGAAIPHARIAGLPRIYALFATLDHPIEFDAFDGEPVDLIFLLLSPLPSGQGYLTALAAVARLLGNPLIADRLRLERDRSRLYRLLVDREPWTMSARRA